MPSHFATLEDHAFEAAGSPEVNQELDPGSFAIPTGPFGAIPGIPDETAAVGPTRLLSFGVLNEFTPRNRDQLRRLIGNFRPEVEVATGLMFDKDPFFGGQISGRTAAVPGSGIGPIPELRVPAEVDHLAGVFPQYGQAGRVDDLTDEKGQLTFLRWLTGVPLYQPAAEDDDQTQGGPRRPGQAP